MKYKYLFGGILSAGYALYNSINYITYKYTSFAKEGEIKSFPKKEQIIDVDNEHLTIDRMEEILEEVTKNKHIGNIKWNTCTLPGNSEELKQKIENKIIENNKNYKHHPSDFIHALLSSHVYINSTSGARVEFEPTTDKGYKYNQYLTKWKVQKVYDKPEAGRYYAASYTNDEDYQLVLAHRGTTSTLKDLFSPKS